MKKYEIIINDIKSQIKNGILKDGDKIPTEKECEKIYGVSRITVQTAMQHMKNEGIICRKAGAGTYCSLLQPPKTQEVSPSPKNFITFICYNSVNELMQIIEGANSVIEKNDLFIYLRITNGNPVTEAEAIQTAMRRGTQGIIIFPTEHENNVPYLQKLVNQRFPIIFVDRNPLHNCCNYVSTNNYLGLRSATEHLLQYGHRKIAYISSGTSSLPPLQERMRGFLETLTESDVPIEKNTIISIKNLVNSKYSDYTETDKKIREIFSKDDHPTALICCNDLIALHCIRLLRSMSFKIPEDVSVVGYDNTTLAANPTYNLTTVDQQFFNIGKSAAEILMNYIDHRDNLTNSIVEPKLIVRNSTKRII